MAACSPRCITSVFYGLKIPPKGSYFTRLSKIRSRLSSDQPFSTTTRGHFQKLTKDEPFSFSKSKARSHTVDESLGISQPSSSKFPLFLGLGLFGIVIYVSFFRHESKESTQTLEEIFKKMRTVHEENQMKSLQDNIPDNINNEINSSKN